MRHCLVCESDRNILRALAVEVAEVATRSEQIEKSIRWQRHNDLLAPQPLVFCDPENGWNEIIPPSRLRTRGELARGWEFSLIKRLDHARFLKDDLVIDDVFSVPLVVTDTGWGVEIRRDRVEAAGAYRVKPAIAEYEEDFGKLHFPEPVVDWPASDRLLEEAREVFGGLLRVERRMAWWWSLGLTCHYIDLRGLENFLCDLILEPEWVHRMMGFLCDGALRRLDALEKNGLLWQNTGNHYVGSGGFGFTNQIALVQPGRVTPMDMWGFVESQETSEISPEMYGEFVFPYHLKLAERFGLNCFGCCEPYEGRWQYARQLPRLRRVSCSPWSDRSKMHEQLGANYVASIKLNPSPLSRPQMDEAYVRAQLRDAVEHSVGCVPEFIMKDNHTLGNRPQNAARWVEIAREEIDRASGL